VARSGGRKRASCEPLTITRKNTPGDEVAAQKERKNKARTQRATLP
jgi:hypothetical protein